MYVLSAATYSFLALFCMYQISWPIIQFLRSKKTRKLLFLLFLKIRRNINYRNLRFVLDRMYDRREEEGRGILTNGTRRGQGIFKIVTMRQSRKMKNFYLKNKNLISDVSEERKIENIRQSGCCEGRKIVEQKREIIDGEGEKEGILREDEQSKEALWVDITVDR